MKTTMVRTGLSLALVMLSFFAARAQNDEITLSQSIWGMQKRDIVTQYMKLSDTEAPGFWKEYDAYETDRKKIGMERALLVTDYVNNYATLTDVKATELVKKISANNIEFEKLELKTFEKMSKVITAVRAAQFIQLENYLLNAIRITMQESLPFVGDLERIKKK
jgi:Spy/CpxP family protein refolding chaperone